MGRHDSIAQIAKTIHDPVEYRFDLICLLNGQDPEKVLRDFMFDVAVGEITLKPKKAEDKYDIHWN